MPKPKLVAEEGTGVTKKTSGKKTYVFNKNTSFEAPCDLGEQGTIKFSRTKMPNGSYSDFSTFVTTDEEVAKALKAYAKNNPWAFIFEKQ